MYRGGHWGEPGRLRNLWASADGRIVAAAEHHLIFGEFGSSNFVAFQYGEVTAPPSGRFFALGQTVATKPQLMTTVATVVTVFDSEGSVVWSVAGLGDYAWVSDAGHAAIAHVVEGGSFSAPTFVDPTGQVAAKPPPLVRRGSGIEFAGGFTRSGEFLGFSCATSNEPCSVLRWRPGTDPRWDDLDSEVREVFRWTPSPSGRLVAVNHSTPGRKQALSLLTADLKPLWTVTDCIVDDLAFAPDEKTFFTIEATATDPKRRLIVRLTATGQERERALPQRADPQRVKMAVSPLGDLGVLEYNRERDSSKALEVALWMRVHADGVLRPERFGTYLTLAPDEFDGEFPKPVWVGHDLVLVTARRLYRFRPSFY